MTYQSPLESAAWFVLGIGSGFAARWWIDTIRRRRRRRSATTPPETTVSDKRQRFDVPRIVNLIIVLLVIGSAVQAYTFNARTKAIVDCLNGYAIGVAAALDARSNASAAAQRALDGFLGTVGQVISGQASADGRVLVGTALAEYLDKRRKAVDEQARNPYPPAPVDLCK